ncbi:putative origin recognition complex, subunit 3 [Helianthus annuus]|uniref:Origin recognition complex, subunit 3 n=1 Tax=Helianthus annuus TaxID=4232 RepID=A0A251SBT2_HELAN|nr:origin of replication complex subunit 3 isoform X2 [Helianthus annuus]KAF5766369.1 putative origin recognition complex, subunit 3 [Helianthus annuus]KAJ0452769.1 putative origin recognition complex, subunit 3 [Helianthus annuus]KAJ0457765.1 putative origin recognition complex, subunit 3 [Helianthus annuus]KAJ0474679.1 putative origin recognition complex, subunit 3 [Helianthus annuus]KAJ0650233.1 putative origin recognition complex, subunit 3 [Helianthus annuus]
MATADEVHISDNDLKPFFVLHKASNSQQHARKPVGRTSRKVKVNLSSSLAASDESQLLDDQLHKNSRMKNFHDAWVKIESTIKDVLHNINADVFNEINGWVQKSFGAICSSGKLDTNKATCSYPIVTDVTSNQIFTAFVVMSNIEFVDDLQTFADLGVHLQSHGCHMANLSSVDFSAKSGIGGCLRSLLRQILNGSTDAADISILASWYMEHDNYKNPVVVIIEDMDRCSASVLSDFILMLSEWVIKIPVILILGVATTLEAPKNILSSKAVQHLSPSKFFLGHPTDRLDAIIEAVLVKPCSGFLVGHKVAAFIRNCFLRQDGTLTSFVRAVKMAIVQHFLMEPLSFTVKGLLDEEVAEADAWPRQALDLPSCMRLSEPKSEALLSGASQMKEVLNLWSSVVLCLHEVGKNQRTTLLDLYDEALDPKLYNLRNSDHLEVKPDPQRPSWNYDMHGQSFERQKGGLISRTIRQIRDLPPAALHQLLEKWDKQTEGVDMIHEKVKELRLQEDDNLKEPPTRSRKQTIRNNGNSDKLSEKAAALITCMTREHMQPIECIPFHEIVCFRNADKLQAALVGDPRKRIQLDLLECNKFLKCSCCCTKSHNVPISSMHDTSLMYTLAQEHGNLINLHDWYQSFKAVISQTTVKDKHKSKVSPSPKKRKITAQPQIITEASAQARFCRAVTELQITGLLRMPSKRRQDYVQRVAFGL